MPAATRGAAALVPKAGDPTPIAVPTVTETIAAIPPTQGDAAPAPTALLAAAEDAGSAPLASKAATPVVPVLMSEGVAASARPTLPAVSSTMASGTAPASAKQPDTTVKTKHGLPPAAHMATAAAPPSGIAAVTSPLDTTTAAIASGVVADGNAASSVALHSRPSAPAEPSTATTVTAVAAPGPQPNPSQTPHALQLSPSPAAAGGAPILASEPDKPATPTVETAAALPTLVAPSPTPGAAVPAAGASPVTTSAAAMAAPAAQVAPALIQLAHAANGHQITLRLAPAELGRVDIRIDRAADGTASVQVVVDRPETLKLLQADQPRLNQALDAAGLPQEGRSLSLSLALPDPGSAGGSQAGLAGGGQDSARQGGARQDGSPQGSGQSRTADHPVAARAGEPAFAAGWRRAGIDITA